MTHSADPFKTGALASSQFRWFYWGRTVSLFGSAMTPVALAFAVLQARQGQNLLGYILGAEILPNVLMLLIGGSIADRYRRDRLILLSNLGSGLSQVGIAAIVPYRGESVLDFPISNCKWRISSLHFPSYARHYPRHRR